MNRRALISLLAAVALTLGLTGCGPSEEELASAARAERWAEIQALQQTLQEKRNALKEVRQQINAGEESLEVPEGLEAADVLAALEEKAAEISADVVDTADDFVPQLVSFINESQEEVGNESTELIQALRMKTDEDIELALEYVEEGGDYSRAIDILSASAQYDPDYERLKQVQADLASMRYVTEERFGELKKGMTPSEVRAILGPVNLRNVRDFEDGITTGWFYLKDPEITGDAKAAAGIFFRKGKVYDLQWEIKT